MTLASALAAEVILKESPESDCEMKPNAWAAKGLPTVIFPPSAIKLAVRIQGDIDTIHHTPPYDVCMKGSWRMNNTKENNA